MDASSIKHQPKPKDGTPWVALIATLLAYRFSMLNHASWFSFVGFGEFAKESGRTVSTFTHRKTISTCRASSFPMAEAPVTCGAGF
jgi:hypothetical protein